MITNLELRQSWQHFIPKEYIGYDNLTMAEKWQGKKFRFGYSLVRPKKENKFLVWLNTKVQKIMMAIMP